MNNKKITRRMLRLLSMKISITTVVVAVSTTVALFGGHIVIVSAQLEDRTTLFTVAGLLIVLSWGAAWIIPKLLSESLEEHSGILRALLIGNDDRNGEDNEDYDSQTFRHLAENVNEVFWVADQTGKKMQYASPAFEKIWGKSLEVLEEQDKNWIDTIHINDQENVSAVVAKSTNDSFDIEFRIIRADGVVRWIRNRGFPVRNDKGKLTSMVGIAEDITESKVVELAKTEFVSLASHQLRTPLSTLKWAIEVLSESTTNFSDTQKRLLDNAQAAMVRMGETINAMLTASRIQSQQISMQAKNVDVKKILNMILQTYKMQSDKKSHTVKIECPDECFVYTDENMLTEIISNLLSNAIHYTQDKGAITLSAKENKETDTVTIGVSDNGIGIPKEDQSMLFSKLFRGKNAMLMDTNGTGLGLYVSKSLTDVIGGKISFKSEENKGTSFDIELPISER